ncbi:MAG: hypothetical protein KC933_37255 [Myxococcales bacterium]|nr:hypothetical protein [Myxococcales bacterium]
MSSSPLHTPSGAVRPPADILLGVRMSDVYEAEGLAGAQALCINEVGHHATWLLVTARRLYVVLRDARLLLPHVVHSEDHQAADGVPLAVGLRTSGETTFVVLEASDRAFVSNGPLATQDALSRALGDATHAALLAAPDAGEVQISLRDVEACRPEA